MKRIIAIVLILVFLSACAPAPREALVTPVLVETTKEIDRNERIADKDEFVVRSGDLSDLYPTEGALHMGYDGDKTVFYFRFSDDSYGPKARIRIPMWALPSRRTGPFGP